MLAPAKRRRALLESNPLRNNRRDSLVAGREFNHKDFRPADSESHAIDSLMP